MMRVERTIRVIYSADDCLPWFDDSAIMLPSVGAQAGCTVAELKTAVIVVVVLRDEVMETILLCRECL
jgi:hypothetical protein